MYCPFGAPPQRDYSDLAFTGAVVGGQVIDTIDEDTTLSIVNAIGSNQYFGAKRRGGGRGHVAGDAERGGTKREMKKCHGWNRVLLGRFPKPAPDRCDKRGNVR